MRSRVQGERVLKSGDIAVNIGDRFCEEEGYGVIIYGRTFELGDLGIPLWAMVQYSMREIKNGEWTNDELND